MITIQFIHTINDFENELVIGDYGVTLSNGLTIQSDKKILINTF